MRKMWLLLVAAGTGYLARCWQKTNQSKSAGRCQHIAPNCSSKRKLKQQLKTDHLIVEDLFPDQFMYYPTGCPYAGHKESLNVSRILPGERTVATSHSVSMEYLVHSSTSNPGDLTEKTIPSVSFCLLDKKLSPGTVQGNYNDWRNLHEISLGKLAAGETSLTFAALDSHSTHLNKEDSHSCIYCSDQYRGHGNGQMGKDIEATKLYRFGNKKHVSELISKPDLKSATKNKIEKQMLSENSKGLLNTNTGSESRKSNPESILFCQSNIIANCASGDKQDFKIVHNDGYERCVDDHHHDNILCSVGRKCFVHPRGSEEIMDKPCIESNANYLLKGRILPKRGVVKKRESSQLLNVSEKKSGKVLCELFKDPFHFHQLDLTYCAQNDDYSQNEDSGRLPQEIKKEKSITAFPSQKKTRGSLPRRVCFRRSLKNVPCLKIFLRDPCEKNKSRFFVFQSYLLQALVHLECLNQHEHKHMNTFCSFLNSKEGRDVKISKNHAANLGGFNLALDSTFAEAPLKIKVKNNIREPFQRLKGNPKSAPISSQKIPARHSNSTGAESAVFGFGMGVGIMLMMVKSRREFEHLGELLKETKSLIHDIRKEVKPNDPLAVRRLSKLGFHDDNMVPSSKPCVEILTSNNTPDWTTTLFETDIVKSPPEVFDSEQKKWKNIMMEKKINEEYHMVDLEAELEAELELMELNIHSGDTIKYQRWKTECMNLERQSCLENNNQINSEFPLGSESEQNDFYLDNNGIDTNVDATVPHQVHNDLCENIYAISPTELERKLWKVLEQRQEDRISELENTLHVTHKKLSAKEVELRWWKDHVWWLMELSFGNTSGIQHPLISLETQELSDPMIS